MNPGMQERQVYPGYPPQPYQGVPHTAHQQLVHHGGQQGGIVYTPYNPQQQFIQSFQHGYQHPYPTYTHEQHHQPYLNPPYNHQPNPPYTGSNPPFNPQNNPRSDTKFLMTRAGSTSQANAAASFYAKRQSKQQVASNLPKPPSDTRFNTNSSEEEEKLRTNFRSIIVRAPPPLPHSLMARIDSGEETGMGKVRVIVRISSKRPLDEERTRYFNVDKKKRQVTMLDPTVGRGEIPIEERKVGVAAPKMFAYDGIFSIDDSQEEVSTACLTDVISSVINGNDGCLFCFGHSNLGKTYTMVGDDSAKSSVGVIPTAIAWMYKVIKDRKQKTSARFSVRVSAVEISQDENLRDLLTNYASETDQSPGVYLRQLPASQSCVLQNLSEVRASSVDKAAYYLDAALSSRTTDAQGRQSHFLYTIHVYQYSVEKSGKGGVAGGRSRLHLIDFGGCDRTQGPGSGITLSGLGNVILGIFNGQKHLPCRNSKVTGILKECLGSLTCNATMVAHVSPEPSHYSETLHTLQLASRIHRMRRKRMKNSSGRGGSNSSDEGRRMGRGSSKSGSSDFTTSTDPSSSEMSCNTVVYRGHSDGSGTDGEHPPNLGIQRFKRRNLSGSRILTNGTISPRLSASPQPSSPLSPANSQYLISGSPARLTPTLPSIRESNTGKMPLNGKVPGYRQPAQVWIDGDKERQAGVGVQRYGYMDDFKANMINTWVENQKDASGSLYLTQFKQADSDEGSERVISETKVEVHHPNERRPGPPPPPPRRSSSREKELHLGGSVVGLQPYALSKSQSSPRGPTLNLEDLSRDEPHDLVDTVPVPRLRPREDLGICISARDDPDLSARMGPDPRLSPLDDQGSRLSPRGETEGSDSSEPLPEPNFEQLFPSELLGIFKNF